MEKLLGVIGALLGLTAVGMGAFGAHGLKAHFQQNPAFLAHYKTAVEYHMFHALAIFVVAWAYSRWPGTALAWAGYLMILGIVLFSGSLYTLSLTGLRWLGAVTPIGGTAFLIGWALLGIGIWRYSTR